MAPGKATDPMEPVQTITAHVETVPVAAINDVLRRHDHYRNAYFWTPRGNAAARRREEAQNSVRFEFRANGHRYLVDQDVTVSCANVYYRLGVYVDGAKKTVRALKSLVG